MPEIPRESLRAEVHPADAEIDLDGDLLKQISRSAQGLLEISERTDVSPGAREDLRMQAALIKGAAEALIYRRP